MKQQLHSSIRTCMIAMLFCGAGMGGAQEPEEEPIVTDRPDFTESTVTVSKGRTQLEGGFTFTRMGADKGHTLGEILIRIGTSDRTEARIGLNSYTWVRSPGGNISGLEDASLGMKFRLATGSEEFNFSRPDISLIAHTTLPTGKNGIGENDLQPEAKLLFGWDLSEKGSMGANLNYGYASEEGENFGQFSGSVTFGWVLNQKTSAFFEYFGFVPESDGGPNTSYLDTGLTYLVNNDYQLDFRVGAGLNGNRNDYFIGAGAARRW